MIFRHSDISGIRRDHRIWIHIKGGLGQHVNTRLTTSPFFAAGYSCNPIFFLNYVTYTGIHMSPQQSLRYQVTTIFDDDLT